MPEQTYILKRISELRSFFEERDIERVRIFGSYAKGNQTDKSDIDLLVDFKSNPGLLKFCQIKNELAAHLGHEIDLVTTNALHPVLKESILKDAKDVLFES